MFSEPQCQVPGVRDPEFDINSVEDMSNFLKRYELSKRGLLRLVQSHFDPLHLYGQIRCYLTLISRCSATAIDLNTFVELLNQRGDLGLAGNVLVHQLVK